MSADDASPLKIAISIVKQKEYAASGRLNAILYMVENFEPECFVVLEEILNDPDEDTDVRCAAALAIGKLGGERALTLLKQMALSDNATVKNYSVQALGMLGREECVPTLLDALKDKDNTVFASAAEALGRIGRPVVPHLIALLGSGHAEDARCIAAWQLGLLRYVDAVPSLVRVIQQEANTELVALAIWALGEIGKSEDVLPTLQRSRRHTDPAISRRAEMAIKKITRHIN